MRTRFTRAFFGFACVALACACSRSPSKRTDSAGVFEEVSPPSVLPNDDRDSVRSTRLKGFLEISAQISDRIIVNRNTFSLGSYLKLEAFSFFDPVHLLMGGYTGFGVQREFKNGTPSAVSILLWRVTLLGFAHDLSRICLGGEDSLAGVLGNLQPQFAADLKALCSANRDPASSGEVASKVWVDLMAFDAPQEEAGIWTEFLASKEMKNETPEDFVEASLTALFLNPYFLMRSN